jgi:hypothetical protein
MIPQTIFSFKLETTKEKLTAHGGLALMAEFNHGIGLKNLCDRHLPKPESNRGFKSSIFVDTLVLMLQAGGSSLEDIRELNNEEGLMKLIGRNILPNPDTVGDWLRRIGNTDNSGLDKTRIELNHRLLKRDGIKEYTLDADATEIIAEKVDSKYTYKGNKGYMPMLGFLYEPGLCIYDEFREGNIAPATGQLEFYLACKERMPIGKKIKNYRADSASYQAELINQLELYGVKYGITAVMDKAVKSTVETIEEDQWIEPKKGCGYKIAETIHSMNKTKKAFRLVIKRQPKEKDIFDDKDNGFKYHAIATNYSEEEKSTYEAIKWHNQRGQAENFNKELKIGFGMENMPCGQSSANRVFFRIGIIAYNLFIGFKRLSCPEAWQKHTIGTFRWKMVQVAGRIVKHAGEIILKLSIDIEQLELFKGIRKKIYEVCLCTDN